MIRFPLCALLALCTVLPSQANAQLVKKVFPQTRQTQICTGPQCQLQSAPRIYSQPAVVTPVSPVESHVRVPCATFQLLLTPLAAEETSIDLTAAPVQELAEGDDRFARVIRATCRITVSGVCGSGTVVGRDADGNSLVLTNAHVAGTQRGRQVSVERWNPDGSNERGTGSIIAAGYGRGLSIDFALLKCSTGFAKDVSPIPLADRYPDVKAGVTTYGCPRCEWPSLQVLRMTRNEGQVLRWLPEAIGGRSGSSLIDHTSSGPRVVGLLTWGGGGEGLGQSTPFLLDAMRGKLPKSFEALPNDVQELSSQAMPAGIAVMPCTVSGLSLAMSQSPIALGDVETDGTTDSPTIDSIVEQGPDTPNEDAGLLDRLRPNRPGVDGGPAKLGPIGRFSEWMRRVLVTLCIAVGAAVAGYLYGRLR